MRKSDVRAPSTPAAVSLFSLSSRWCASLPLLGQLTAWGIYFCWQEFGATAQPRDRLRRKLLPGTNLVASAHALAGDHLLEFVRQRDGVSVPERLNSALSPPRLLLIRRDGLRRVLRRRR